MVVQFLENGVRHTIPEDQRPIFSKGQGEDVGGSACPEFEAMIAFFFPLRQQLWGQPSIFGTVPNCLLQREDWIVRKTAQSQGPGNLLGTLRDLLFQIDTSSKCKRPRGFVVFSQTAERLVLRIRCGFAGQRGFGFLCLPSLGDEAAKPPLQVVIE